MKQKRPPRLAAWMLSRVSGAEGRSSILGDYEEMYADLARERGAMAAHSWYWSQVLKSYPMFAVNQLFGSVAMIRNHFKIAWRNILKNKGFSFLNVTGLAAGMACCLLILLWVGDELSYDRFHKNHRDIYQTAVTVAGRWIPVNPLALAPILKREYPGIKKACRFDPNFMLVAYREDSGYEQVGLVDPEFLEIFTFPLIKGDQTAALRTPDSAVITEKLARKYFKNEDPMGKIITLDNRYNLTVVGMMRDVPPNSHLEFSLLAPLAIQGNRINTSFSYEVLCYLLLEKNSSVDQLRRDMAGAVKKFDLRPDVNKGDLDLQPLSRVHLYDLNGGGQILYIYIFSTVALFVLIIACINFMNLSTARSGARAKEVGLRKTIGALRMDIVRQHYSESLLMSFLALAIAFVIVIISLPAFNALAQKSLRLNLAGNPSLWLGLAGIALLTGLLSGSYPALYLSAFRPADVLKGSAAGGAKRPLLRRILVVSQFTVAVILITGTIIAARQMSFIRNRNLGFSRANVLSLPLRGIRQNYEAFKTEALRIPGVLRVTAASSRPTSVGIINPVAWEGGEPGRYETMNYDCVDHDYIKTLEMKIIEGRDYSREYPSDINNFIVNEAAVKLMGLQNPVGKWISVFNNKGLIIGVVKDFHSQSLRRDISPLVLTLKPNVFPSTLTLIKIGPENISRTLDALRATWKKFAGNYPFDYLFLDEAFNEMYRSDRRTGEIFRYFAILAIFISCLGIFGLAAYTAERRTKEIGIRKILGASVPSLMGLISREFMVLVAAANGIAFPLGYWLSKKWLQGYAYRTGIPIWIFLMVGGLSLIIALGTVSAQAFRAARTDPARTLKYE